MTLTVANADRDGRSLHLAFADDAEFKVDLQPFIKRAPRLRPLSDAATFRRAKRGPWGARVDLGHRLFGIGGGQHHVPAATVIRPPPENIFSIQRRCVLHCKQHLTAFPIRP